MRLTARPARANNERAAKPRQAGGCPRARDTRRAVTTWARIPGLDHRSAYCDVCVLWSLSHSTDCCTCGAVALKNHMRSHGHQQTIPTLTWAAEVVVLLIPASFLESFCLKAHSPPSLSCLSLSSPTPRVAGAEAARSNTVRGSLSATPHTPQHGLRSTVHFHVWDFLTGPRYAGKPSLGLSRSTTTFWLTDSCIIS